MATLFDSTLGALLVGVLLSAAYALTSLSRKCAELFSGRMYGITCLQVFAYWVEYSSDDRLYLKLFVAGLWSAAHPALICLLTVLDTAHLALVAHSIYFYSITSFCNLLALEKVRPFSCLSCCTLIDLS
jgi:hypothetical protein